MGATREESTRLGFTPIRLTWTPSVANSRVYRLEKPISPRRLRTFTELTRDLRSIRTSRVLPRVPEHEPAFAKPAAFRPACAGR